MTKITYAYSLLEVQDSFQKNKECVVTIYKDKDDTVFPANHVNLAGSEFELLQRNFSDLREFVFTDRRQDVVAKLTPADLMAYLADTKRELEKLTQTDFAAIAKAKALSLTAKK